MNFGLFTIDFTAIGVFFSQDTNEIMIQSLAIGWVVLVCMLLSAFIQMFLKYKQKLYTKNWKWMLLAVDVPPMNVQTPKAVEQMFNHLAGAFNNPDLEERFIEGFKQRWFSFEIISIEGYIQFLIRTESRFLDLVEAAVYAQYSDAAITEVEDYVEGIPNRYPNDEYEILGIDFGLSDFFGQPIRSYTEFEHKISKDTVLKDPMGTFLESFSRLGPGEQMWFQILVEPISSSWKEEVIKKMAEMTGQKKTGKNSFGDYLTQGSLKSIETIGDLVFNREAGDKKDEKKEAKKELSPGQGKQLEGMETKIMKIGFKTKMRGIYIAKKEVFRPEKGMNAMVGALSQFNIPSSNCLVPVFKTARTFFFKKQRSAFRKRLMMQAFKKRRMKTGGTPFVLNIEELASVWHFPMSHVKTPLVQKAVGKRAEPPSGLPVESALRPVVDFGMKDTKPAVGTQVKKGFATDAGHIIVDDDQAKFG